MTGTIPLSAVEKSVGDMTTVYAEYNASKAEYESGVSNFNALWDEHQLLTADWFASLFYAAVILPKKPVKPDLPPAYTFYSYHRNNTVGDVLLPGEGYTNQTSTINAGFLLPTNSTETPFFNFTGHSFGLMGQGLASMPANATGFDQSDFNAYSSAHTLIVSYFPNDETWAGLGSDPANAVALNIGAYTWTNDTALTAPVRPTLSTMSVAESATILAGSAAAGLAVVSNYF